MAFTVLKISLALVAVLASNFVNGSGDQEKVTHHGWGHQEGHSKDNGWGHEEVKSHGGGHQEVKGQGWGHQEAKGHGWGHQEVKGHGWGHQEAKAHGWGHQEVKGHGWGHQEVKGHGWGHQEVKGHGWGQEEGKGHGWGHDTKRQGWSSDYKYAYGVNDKHTGDIKSAQESRQGGWTKGSYSLLQPDGKTRTVKYEADPKNGFRAEVDYKGWAKPETHGWEHATSHEKKNEGESQKH